MYSPIKLREFWSPKSCLGEDVATHLELSALDFAIPINIDESKQRFSQNLQGGSGIAIDFLF